MKIWKQIKRACKFGSEKVERKLEKIVGLKQILKFCTMEDELALRNKDQMFVYNTKHGQLLYSYRLKTLTDYSQLNLYYVNYIKLRKVLMLLFVLTDRIVVKYKNRLIFQLKINQPLYRYERFDYDPYENYFIIIGKTMADNFTLLIVTKLFSKEQNYFCQTPTLLRLSLSYNSVFYNTKTQFRHLTSDYLTIHSISILPLHKLFIYNKKEKELYLCDLNELFHIYPTYAYLDEYQFSIFQIDKSQNCLPMQAIIGAYSKVNATRISSKRNLLLLIQDKDPISEVVWEEQYSLEDDGNLQYINRNKARREWIQ